MLKFMRANKKLKWILWPIVASFVFGIFAFFGGALTSRGRVGAPLTWAARVGGDEISIRQFQNAYQAQERYFRQMFGRNFNPDMLRQFDVGGNALRGLVRSRVALLEADRLGLRATPEEVFEDIRQMEVFQKDGQFVGVDEYERILREQGVHVPDFERGLAEDIVLRKYQELLRASIYVSEEDIRKEFDGANDKASISYALLAPVAYADRATVDPAAERAFYESHKDRYRSEEQRKVRYLLLRLDERAKLLAARDESKLRGYYEENKDSLYAVPVGSRRARHILLQVKPDAGPEEDAAARARAEELTQRARSGEPFPDLALRYSQDLTSARRGGDLGYFKRGDMVPPFEDAVFSMTAGEIRGPVRTDFGYHVIQLVETEEAGARTRPFEDVRDEIAVTLGSDEAREQVATSAEEIRKDLDEGKTLDEIAAARSLVLTDGGWVTRRAGLPELGGYENLTEALFALETGKVSAPLDAYGGDRVFLQVQEVKAPEPLPFEQVQPRLLADMKQEKQKEFALADAGRIRAALLSGTSFEEALKGLPGTPPVQSLPTFTRLAGIPQFQDAAGLLDEILSLEAGGVGTVHDTAGGALVYRVDTREKPDPSKFEAEKEGIRERLTASAFDQRYTEILEALVSGPYKSKIQYNSELLRLVSGPATAPPS